MKNTILSLILVLISFPTLAAEKFKTIRIDDLEKKISNSKVFIYDVNVESTRQHVGIVPGAVLIDSGSSYDVTKTLPNDKNSMLVFYCANTMCTSSHMAADRAIAAGYSDVSVMKEGIYGWQKAGKKIVSVAQTGRTPQAQSAKSIEPKEAQALVKNKKAIIIDVREEEERHEVVENAKWFPMSKLGDEKAWNEFKNQLPKDQNLIFYCASGFRSKKISEKMANEGYSSSYFKGPDQWKAAGLPLVNLLRP